MPVPMVKKRFRNYICNCQWNKRRFFLTSSFCFASAAEAVESFANSTEGQYTYSRFSNPSVDMFQNWLAALEGGEICVATASGMSAIMSVVMSVLQVGDHLVSSRSIFGSCIAVFRRKRARRPGITGGLIRLAVGLESSNDLRQD